VKLPWNPDNRDWLRGDRQRRPKWDPQRRCWEIPRTWLSPMVDQILERWTQLYLIHPYREMEKCAPACWNATGYDCQCSCMGKNHGIEQTSRGVGGWHVVSETCAVRWGERTLAVRLMVRRAAPSEAA